MASLNDNFIYIFIFILVSLVIAFSIWAFVMIQNYNSCINGESAYCPQLYCDTPSEACDNTAYRTDSNGNTVCGYFLLELSAPIVSSEGGSGGSG
jgi:hypothetical protein